MNKKGIFLLATVALATLGKADVGMICQIAPAADPVAIATRYGITYVDRTQGAPFVYFRAATEAKAHAVQLAMATDAQIVWAEDDKGVSTPETEKVKNVLQKGSTLPAVGDRYALYQHNANFLLQINWSSVLANAPGRTVKVAILDTGLSPHQPYLAAKVDASINVIEPNLPAYDIPQNQDSNRNGIKDEMVGHGTMVAGIVDQIAPQSRFVIARVANSDGYATAWTLIKGLAFASVSGAEVANISLGTLDDLPALSDVMDWCESRKLLVVAAIGNNGVKNACMPAKISKVVCVGGLLPNNAKAPFSNWDSACDVSGPATGIVSQNWDGTLGIWSGTSFSTPMAAGIVADALRRSSGPVFPSRVRDTFRGWSNDLDRYNPKYKGKIGRLLDHTRFVQGLTSVRP